MRKTESPQLYVLFRLAREFPAPAGPELIQEVMAYNKEIVSRVAAHGQS
jgi:hypothetical protein